MNIQGCNSTSGLTLLHYFPPQPTDASFHRYVFLVFKQPGQVKLNRPIYLFDDFSTRNFTEEYNLGDPVAGNFFLTRKTKQFNLDALEINDFFIR